MLKDLSKEIVRTSQVPDIRENVIIDDETGMMTYKSDAYKDKTKVKKIGLAFLKAFDYQFRLPKNNV